MLICSLLLGRSTQTAGRVDDIDAIEARRARTVRHGRYLAGLPLAVEERAAEAIVALVADRRARVPELRRAHLVGDVLEHGPELAVLDLVEQLAAELRVVALLVDGEGTGTHDVDAVLHVLDHVGDGELVLAGRKRDVRHALELHAGP